MAQVSIPWNDGNGNIILTYTGQGDGTVVVKSDTDNFGNAREQTISVKTADGKLTKSVTVRQKATELNFKTADGMFIKTADGKFFNTK